MIVAPWAERGLAAQESDHLTCFKVKDAAKVKGEETVDLCFPGLQPPVGVDGCEVKKVEKFVCLTTITNDQDDFRGPSLAPAYVCYTVECPEDAFKAVACSAPIPLLAFRRQPMLNNIGLLAIGAV